MNSIEAITLGVIQGLTEFLPVSSSGHLFLVESFFGLEPSLIFELYLHIGTLAAVLIYFWKDIRDLLVGFFEYIRGDRANKEGVFALQLLVATTLTFPTAYLVKAFVFDSLSIKLVAITLMLTAGLILISEYARPKIERKLSWEIIILLGLVQGFALIPGISRSGLTIAFLLLLGVNRTLSARASFLLSIPTIAGAALFAYLDTTDITSLDINLSVVLGVITSAVVGYLGIAWMMRLVEGKWIYFVPYCAGLGLILFLI